MKIPFNLSKGAFIGICIGAVAIITAIVIAIALPFGGNSAGAETPESGTEQSNKESQNESVSSSSENSLTASQSSSGVSESSSSSSASSSAPHTHKFTEKVIAPTCKEGGYTLKECACGYSETYNETKALAHTFGDWIVKIQPTEQTKGYRERFCSVCDQMEHEDLEKLEPVIEAASWNEEVLRLVNIERQNNGLAPLSYAWNAQSAADIRAAEIVELFDHTRPNGETCFTALDQAGVSYYAAGENIAMGQTTPKEVVEDWMNSPGHRANILSGDFTSLAVGINGNAWVQLFLG